MKQIKHYKKFTSIWLLFAMVITWSCQTDSPLQENGTIVFGAHVNQANRGGRTQSDVTPASLLISIRNPQTGVDVLSHYSMVLTAFGNSFVTDPLSIAEGAYELTEFIVLNANDEAIYAAPSAGSVKANLVAASLPINLTITSGENTTFTPEVVAINSDSTPEEFGIVSLGFSVASAPSIRIEAPTGGLSSPLVRAFVINTTTYQRRWVDLVMVNNTAVAELELDAGYYIIEINYEVPYSGSMSVSKKTLKSEKIIEVDNQTTKQVNFSSPAAAPSDFTEWFKLSGPDCSFDFFVSMQLCSPSYKINLCSDLIEGYFFFGKDYFPNGSPGVGSSSYAELFIGNDISDDAVFNSLSELGAPPQAFSSLEMQKKLNTGIITGSFDMGSDDVNNCVQASENVNGKIIFGNSISAYKINGQMKPFWSETIQLK